MFRMMSWKSAFLRAVRLAALAAAVSTAFGSLAWAHDDDDYHYRHDEARDRGYQNGYRDGANRARYDRMQGRRFNYRSDDWEDSRGYEHWMGSHGQYKKAYRQGYENGYRDAFGYGYRHDRDRDDYYRGHDRDDWR